MKITIHLESGKRKITVPENWDQLSLHTFIRIETQFKYDPKNLLQLFSIMTGIELKALEESTEPDLDTKLFNLFGWVFKPPKWDKLPAPHSLQYQDGSIPCKYDFTTTTLGQKLLMEQIIEKYDTPIDAIPEVISIFLQPTKDGKFDLEASKEMVPYIRHIPCIPAYGYAQFFFLKSRNLKRFGQKDLANRQMKNHYVKGWRTISDYSLSAN